ncbi:taste receptor type 2 member 1-like [Hyperolius riggenbachi]|uniref:taste receptor type 2 member 1-like n=1 Tax=Hyperolius riggenbachi TaxID=752182 RepID=UPI0035A3C869
MNFVFVFLFFIFSTLTFVGLFLNGFIFLKNIIDWVKGRNLQVVDIIIASQSLSRIILLFIYTVQGCMLFSSELLKCIIIYIDYIISAQMFVVNCSLWWGTVLCVFYCVKIVNCKSRLLTRLKMNISRMVLWQMFGSTVVSFLSSLPYGFCVYSFHKRNSTKMYSRGLENTTLAINSTSFFTISIVVSMIPFIIFCMAIILLAAPLFHHIRNMKNKNSGFTKAQLDVTLSALRNILSFFTFYLIFFISLNVQPVFFLQYNYDLICLFSICVVAFPSLHSVVLVASNAKLKQSVIAVLTCSKSRHVQ